MKTILICHDSAALDQVALARWLATFSQLVGIIVLRETNRRIWRRIRTELRRSGIIRFLDVLAFRAYYNAFISKNDQTWEMAQLRELCHRYPEYTRVAVLYSHSPNTPEVEQFIKSRSPDIMLARCKTLLKENIFSVPAKGTFVMHPGICPEYRNAHGCFWALANNDLKKVGMTLLRIDKGVDTGPVLGFYTYDYDEVNESHVVIQHRVVLENLELLQKKLEEIYHGQAKPVDVSGRSSAAWGQPWLSAYLRWKYRSRRRTR